MKPSFQSSFLIHNVPANHEPETTHSLKANLFSDRRSRYLGANTIIQLLIISIWLLWYGHS